MRAAASNFFVGANKLKTDGPLKQVFCEIGGVKGRFLAYVPQQSARSEYANTRCSETNGESEKRHEGLLDVNGIR